MEGIVTALAQYGPLGLWTASLLWMNWKGSKDRKQAEREAAEALRYHREQIVMRLIEQEHMLEKALEKIDSGLQQMKEKYAEDRLLRMKDK